MKSEILEVEAEEMGSQLEQVIDKTLVKNNVTDTVIAAMAEKYGGLKLKSLEDKEGYLEICEARKEVRKVGIITEKICKLGREDAVKVQKLWLGKEKTVLEKIAKVQDPLDVEIKRYEDEQERIAQEEIKRKDEAYALRQTTLLKMEAKYENGCFVLGAVSYETENIKEADNEIWEETILPKYKREFAKVEAIRAEEERVKEEAAKALKVAKDKLEQEQAEFRKQQEDFRVQQDALQKQQNEAERLRLQTEANDRQLKAQQEEKLWRNRLAELNNVGWNGQFAFINGSDGNEPVISYKDLIEYDDEGFGIIRDNHNRIMLERKEKEEKLAEEKRLAEIETAKQDAIKKEQERAAEEKRLEEVKKQQQEQIRLEELAKASDKEKWGLYVQQLVALQLPQLNSNIYKGKANIAKEKIEEIINL